MRSHALEMYNREFLPFHLCPIFIGNLTLVKMLDHPIYTFEDNQFIELLPSKERITYEFIRGFALENVTEVFIHQEDKGKIYNNIQQQLLKLSRSLSIGDPFKNSTQQINLLGLQLKGLYNNPFDDALLTSQFQNIKNLTNLLFNNKEILKQVYRNASFQGHHFTIKQPMLSSLLLLSFIKYTKIFNEKETKELFLTSYFKDIGMSFIPTDKYDLANLSKSDSLMFDKHSQSSFEILDKRVPLSKTHLKMIKYHHQKNSNILDGIELKLLNMMDTIVAMTSARPYRPALSFFESLEVVKRSMTDGHSQEFKYLVLFLKQFFSYN